VTPQDVERALAIARGTEAERARFHRAYVRDLDAPFVERVEVVSEFRRVVIIAEERVRKGDRLFAYSVTQAQKAVEPWKRRVGVVARLRFHPLNTYVEVPPVEIELKGDPGAQIGVRKAPLLSLPSPNPADRLPILGAIVEGVFDAAAIGNRTCEFVIRLEGREVGSATFNLASID
jgi:hypothetical protein